MLKNNVKNYILESVLGGFFVFCFDEIYDYFSNYLMEEDIFISNFESFLKKTLIDIIKEENYCIISKNPFVFKINENINHEDFIKQNKLILKERDLHICLEKFLSFLKIKNKTIFHEKSKSKELLKWQQPDIVAFLNNQYYSFELKRYIKLSNIRETSFQALSNSDWANYRYLVFEKYDYYNSDLISEMKYLNQNYGIGFVILNIENYKDTKILYKSKFKNINVNSFNKLFKLNIDFKNFINETKK